ncbi:MAG TPA: GMC oxidoreductase [Solirubrobacteraceae bacterium]|nr:GMC oxidoreductase [Solirubrobacteraceae bacterium]
MTTNSAEYDYIVVGGGTAGAVVASRLSEDQDVSVALVEWGPSDEHEPRALMLRRWAEMMESEFDLDYRSVPQPRGNSHIRQARARILGGCSSHNTMIAFRPPARDLEEWVALGAVGWGPDEFLPYYERLATNILPVAPQHRNPYLQDVIDAASTALSIPVRERWNPTGFADGAGFLELGYYPETGARSSSSVDYLHRFAGNRHNLQLRLEARAVRILFDGDGDGDGRGSERRARAVEVTRADGIRERIAARREIILCAGAIDTPRLLLLSGVGPAEGLRDAGVPVVHDLPGVGNNLMDHPEGLVLWEASAPIPDVGASDWDAIISLRLDPDASAPDILCHIPLMTLADNSERLGFVTPRHSLSLTPNVAKPRSRGRVWIESPDPDRPPLIDYGYFTDPEGHDEAVLLAGMRMARRVAATQPMARWVAREVFPGPEVQSDAELSELARAAHHTVYHVCGTCRIGAAQDPAAVVDPQLRVRGIAGLRIADASVFPTITTVNTVVTVLMVGERAADLIRLGAPERTAAAGAP